MGSSPLARGLLREALDLEARGRIIPARAGFTHLRRRATDDLPDHPHSRGVYAEYYKSSDGKVGSSPLARGLREGRFPDDGSPGIIPARAGFTLKSDHGYPAFTDHPRSRGVYRPPRTAGRRFSGSSPLARGLPMAQARLPESDRIIPARAGFTRRRRARPARTADHPRSRGVYGMASDGSLPGRGSSPLARGLRSVQ